MSRIARRTLYVCLALLLTLTGAVALALRSEAVRDAVIDRALAAADAEVSAVEGTLAGPITLIGLRTADGRIHAGRVLVAEVGGVLVGWALLEVLDGEGHLEEVDVHPDHGRRGHGRALVHAAAELAASLGHRAIVLTTFRSVPWNAPLYRRLGFEEIPEAELTPGLAAVLAREAEIGVTDRCAMRRWLAPGAAASPGPGS